MKYSKLIILALTLILCFSMIRSHVLLIDGGSSKSEVIIVDNNNVPTSCGADKTDPGRLGKVIEDIDSKKAAYITILQGLADKCADKTVQISAIMLFSTAGSRDTINALDTTKRSEVATKLTEMGPALRTALKEKFTEIKDTTPIQIQVISGRYEGLYAFVTLQQFLKNDKDIGDAICGSTNHANDAQVKACLSNVLYLEVGGSSVQLAFTDPKNKSANRFQRLSIRLSKRVRQTIKINSKKGVIEFPEGDLRTNINQWIYSKSWLGNGKNQLAVQAGASCETSAQATTKNTHSTITADEKKSEKNDTSSKYNKCLLKVVSLQKDQTLAGGKYFKSFLKAQNQLPDAKKTKLIINAGGSFVQLSKADLQVTGRDDLKKEQKIYKFANISEYRKYIKEEGLCLLNSNDPDANNRNLCLGFVVPDYLVQSLNIADNVEIYVTKFDWAVGAAYLSGRLAKPTEAFDPVETNSKEDAVLSLAAKAKRRNLRLHKQKYLLKQKLHRDY